MTATMHKLTAGDGYTYLTRQVAAHDATERGPGTLSDYYSSKGESPGVWMGSGLATLPAISAIQAGDRVSEAQMLALFGEGRHPDASAIEAAETAAGVARGLDPKAAARQALAQTKLGTPFRVYKGASDFRKACAEAFVAHNLEHGHKWSAAISDDDRARIRTDIAREMFAQEFGRAPLGDRELSGWVSKNSRQKTTAVAGYDVTFSPVKSVSTLWAVAPREMSEIIESAHQDAAKDALDWLEKNALYTRLGTDGVQQVDTEGMIATAFTHRDSRAGEPDLHTHVAISNKVRLKGTDRWLAVDGRPVHKAMVTVSETYNTRLEGYLRDRLGVEFAERAGTDPTKRPIREIVGVDPRLTERWSSRASAIDARRGELAAKFQLETGREPTAAEARKLNQRANLETREAKHEPRSFAEQRQAWREEAIAVMGSFRKVSNMVRGSVSQANPDAAPVIDDEWIAARADHALTTISTARARWQPWHIRAEAARIVRGWDVAAEDMDRAIEAITATALDPDRSVNLGPNEDQNEPQQLRRSNGNSVYTTEGTQLYTSDAILAAEARIVDAAHLSGGRAVDPMTVDLALLEHAANNEFALNGSQAQMVRDLATSGDRVQLALAPAGTGKTTAMAVLRAAWEADGGNVLGLGPTAQAAEELSRDMGVTCDTLSKLTYTLDQIADADGGRVAVPEWFDAIDENSLVVIDEAGMASTSDLDEVIAFVLERGGNVRLVGDDQQLAAVAAGGVLRDIAGAVGAVTLTDVVRFKDSAEGLASLALREGNPEAIGFYIDHDRVHVGDFVSAEDQVYAAWSADREAGLNAVMLAPTRETVRTLNERARADRIAADPNAVGREVTLADGLSASAGDVITTRKNNRRLALNATDFVRNGNDWIVDSVTERGALRVRRQSDGRKITLPRWYVSEHVQLGYASTVHGAQGMTADTCHTIFTGAESRQLMYVALTRGKLGNHLYLGAAPDGDEHSMLTPDALLPPTAVDIMTRIVGRDGAQESATTAARRLHDPAVRLGVAAPAYDDAVGSAAEDLLGPEAMTRIDEAAEQIHSGLTEQPAWPVLRKHLATLQVGGQDGAHALAAAATARELGTAHDAAAVLDWRLDTSGAHAGGGGPLPWLPALPPALAEHPTWGKYLRGRENLVRVLADQVADRARTWESDTAPVWGRGLLDNSDLLADVAVWRAARGASDVDLRPTGKAEFALTMRNYQQKLDKRVEHVSGSPRSAITALQPLLSKVAPRVLDDPFWPVLAMRLNTARRAGLDVETLVRSAVADHPLPDEMPAASLWWRLSRTLSPAVLDTGSSSRHLVPAWAHELDTVLGEETARRVRDDAAWPALVAAVDSAPLEWSPTELLTFARDVVADARADDPTDQLRPAELTTALAWRIKGLAESELAHYDVPIPDEAPVHPDDDLEAAARAGVEDTQGARREPVALAADVEDYAPLTDDDLPPDPDLPPPPDEVYSLYSGEAATAPATTDAVGDPYRPAPAPVLADTADDMAVDDTLAALHHELADARRDLDRQVQAVRENRGTFLTAAWPMVLDLRERADALRPVYFAAEDAHEVWMNAAHEYDQLEARCADITRTAQALRESGDDLGGLRAEADLSLTEIMRDHARSTRDQAHTDYDHARTELDTAAGGRERIVTSTDVDVARLAAAELDDQAVLSARNKVSALRGAIFRAETHATRSAARAAADTTVLPPSPRLSDTGTTATATLTRPDTGTDGAHRPAPPRPEIPPQRTPVRDQPVPETNPHTSAAEPEAATEHQVQEDTAPPAAEHEVSDAATPAAESTNVPQVDADAIEERIIHGTTLVQMPTSELKSKIKQTQLSQKMNPTEHGAAALGRHRDELARRADLPRDELVAEEGVRKRLAERTRRPGTGRDLPPDTAPRRDRDRGPEL